mgnify:CR=1 FL=1
MENRTDQRVFWHGKLKKESRKTWQATALTALCSVALFCLLFSYKKMYPFGDGSVAIMDLYSQYLPLLYHFYDVVTGQKNLFLDFSVSGGANLYADTINEVLNPFNYVLLLFGRDRIYQAVNVLVLLYSTASAVTAHIFLEKTASGRRFQNVALALCYACCGYMAYNYQIIKWMIFPVIFPLFCLALLRLLREKKGGWYAVLLAWQLMLSIQLGFMTLLFSLFAGAIWLYTCERKENRTRKMGCMGIDTLIGICISAAVLLPSAILLLQSARSGENLSYFGVMKRHGLDDLFERLFQIANPVLIGLLFASGCFRKRKRRSAAERETHSAAERFWLYLTGFLWLTVLLEPANLLWHMGSYVCFPVRYGYMAVLSMAALVAVRKERDRKCLQTSGRAPAALCAPVGCFGCIRIGRCMPDTHLGKASGAGVFLAGDQQGVSERNRCDSGCIAACWSIGVVRTKGAACKDLRGKNRRGRVPGNGGAWSTCWRLLCVYNDLTATRLCGSTGK